MNKTNGVISKAFKTAFPITLPIMAGFLFLGIAYGIYMNISGFSFIYPMLMSLAIYAGSIEFVTVGMLLGSFNPLNALMLTLMINARHLFYGLSMLDKYNVPKLKKFYLIFGMCDESFLINYTTDIPKDVDRGWFMIWVTFLNQCYWVIGATLGGIFGSFINFNTKGLEFVMTALFVVIFLEQWMKEKSHKSSLIGIAASVICLIIFGKNGFIIPSMILIVLTLSLFKKSFLKVDDKV